MKDLYKYIDEISKTKITNSYQIEAFKEKVLMYFEIYNSDIYSEAIYIEKDNAYSQKLSNLKFKLRSFLFDTFKNGYIYFESGKNIISLIILVFDLIKDLKKYSKYEFSKLDEEIIIYIFVQSLEKEYALIDDILDYFSKENEETIFNSLKILEKIDSVERNDGKVFICEDIQFS